MFGQYNSKDWAVIIDDSVNITGLGEDMVSGSKDNETFTFSVGGQGDVVANEANDPLGTITIAVQITCPQRKYLIDWAKQGDFRPIHCANKALGLSFGGSKARPKNYGEIAGKKESEDFTLEIGVADYDVDND